MAFNRIQFQHGISLPEFMNSFGTEERCAVAVIAARWPNGFRCPRCERPETGVADHGARKLFQCQACRHQTSLTAGSLFVEHTKLPLVRGRRVAGRQGEPALHQAATRQELHLRSIQSWAQAALTPGCRVASDRPTCFAAVTKAGCIHSPVVVSGRMPRELPQFTWVNTVLGNLKTSLHGAYHSLEWDKHVDSYLAAFAYRCNRRVALRGLLARSVVDVARCQPHRVASIRGGAEARY